MRGKLVLAVATAAAFAGWGAPATLGAGPAWSHCGRLAKVGKHYAGAYSDKRCTKLNAGHAGRYEIEPLARRMKFSGLGPGRAAKFPPFESTWRVNGDFREYSLHCTGGRGEGEIVPPDEVANVVFKLTGCSGEGGRAYMRTAGAEGVVIGPLSGRLGWVNEAKEELGLDLSNETEPGGPITAAHTEWVVDTGERGNVLSPRGIFGSMIGLVSSSGGHVGRSFTLDFSVAHYLGLIPAPEYKGGCEVRPYEPDSNIPQLEGGLQDVLLMEPAECDENGVTVPLGWEAMIKGEAEEELIVSG
jgi:hypothetical protein